MLNIVESDKRIYLDYAATTPLDSGVLKSMLPYLNPKYGNPSSLHSNGRLAKSAIEDARLKISRIINSLPEEIIFTGSGTESDNLAIVGVARAHKDRGNHIIISSIEHKAVLESAKSLQNEGFVVSILDVDNDGVIDIKECMSLITRNTILVSVMYANNEIGTVEPIKELAEEISKYRGINTLPILHTDACQATPYLPIDVKELKVDLMTINSSKIYGPKGVGILYKKRNIEIEPLIMGGDQEMGIRAGTENISLIVGMSEALRRVENNKQIESERLTKLRNYFISRLFENIPDVILNGHSINRLPNNIHISIPYVEGESMLLMLDHYGVSVSTGSACSSLNLKPSHVLLALGQDQELIHGSIRFSLGKHTSKEEIDYVMSIFPNIVKRLKEISALTRKI